MPTNTQKTRMLVAMTALAATAGVTTTAQAGDAARANPRYDSVIVKYSDLDLSSAAGARALFARLSAAAESACGNAPGTRDLQRQAQFRACYESALQRAVDKVGSRELQALHASGAADHVG